MNIRRLAESERHRLGPFTAAFYPGTVLLSENTVFRCVRLNRRRGLPLQGIRGVYFFVFIKMHVNSGGITAKNIPSR